MDSFRVFLESDASPCEVSDQFRAVGLEAGSEAGEVQVWKDNARVYIYFERSDELNEEDLLDEGEWPIPRERLRTLAVIEVRRNTESDHLAVKVADQLATNFGGVVSWDGMEYWKTIYEDYLKSKPPK